MMNRTMEKRLMTAAAAWLAVLVLSIAAPASPLIDTPAPAQTPLSLKDPAAEPSLSGKVVETMDAAGYTYVCIEKRGVKTWVAVPQMEVKVGRRMAFQPGAEMKNFTSKTLNRTFDRIVFSSGPASSGAAGGAKTVSAGHGGGSRAAVLKPGEKIGVKKATGPNACTVAEVYARRASLNRKTVVIHAKAVKVSLGIMGKNWVHIQDGTGDAAKGTHDLVITTQDSPKVGDVVTVKGTVYKDKDFGAGYKYAVIVEQARVEP